MSKALATTAARVFIVVAGAAVAGSLLFQPGAVERTEIRRPLPDSVLEEVGGGSGVSLSSLAGEPYLLDVWELHCGFCRREIPALNELHRSGGLRVVSLVYEFVGEPVIRSDLHRLGIEFPVYRSDSGLLRSLGGLEAFPTAWLVEGGVAVERVVGYKDESTLRMLAERAQRLRGNR